MTQREQYAEFDRRVKAAAVVTPYVPVELRPVLKAQTAARVMREFLEREQSPAETVYGVLSTVERDALQTLCEAAEKEG